ncbi:MAG TPA: hypothetical protein VL326_21435 [Kofleriaceae bacterium]|nr:hypothetical protein [Kofleriaceae bacterium]
MTAYRASAAPPDEPFVNPYLERALIEYYRNEHRRNVIVPFVVLVGLLVMVAVAWLVFRPTGDWLTTPVGLVGGPCAFGVAITGFGLVRRRRPDLLDRIRTGIPIRRVHREPYNVRVQFADGSRSTLPALGGDLRHLSRIEHLLLVQMELGSVSRLRAS